MLDRIGIEAVALRAGVSIATVSRVLNGIKAKARSETETRVREAALELGYRPAHAGRALRLRQTRLVALLIPDITNAFYSAIARSIETALRERDLTMILCNTREDPALQDFYLEEMRAYHVRGIALLGAVASAGLSDSLSRETPIVFVNRKPPDAVGAFVGAFVGADNHAAGAAVAAHFVAQGFRHCAAIHGPLHSSASRERFQGFVAHLATAGIALADSAIVDGGLAIETGYAAATALLSAQRPRAIFCANDLVAYGLARRCRELGIAIPGDIAIFGFDDNPLNDWLAPWLSTIHIPYDDFGSPVMAAFDRLWAGEGATAADPLPFSVKLRGSAE